MLTEQARNTSSQHQDEVFKKEQSRLFRNLSEKTGRIMDNLPLPGMIKGTWGRLDRIASRMLMSKRRGENQNSASQVMRRILNEMTDYVDKDDSKHSRS